MSDTSFLRREEDEMLRYAHVERSVQKVYAFQFRGYPDGIPYFFTRDLRDRNNLRGKHEQIEFRKVSHDGTDPEIGLYVTDTRESQFCNRGDWIIINEAGKTEIMTDSQYRDSYMPLRDLDY